MTPGQDREVVETLKRIADAAERIADRLAGGPPLGRSGHCDYCGAKISRGEAIVIGVDFAKDANGMKSTQKLVCRRCLGESLSTTLVIE